MTEQEREQLEGRLRGALIKRSSVLNSLERQEIFNEVFPPDDRWIEITPEIRGKLYDCRTPIEVKSGENGIIQTVRCPACQPMWVRHSTHFRHVISK